MKILKTILIVLLVIIAIPLIIGLFVSKDFKAESTVIINKPKQEVFDYVRMVDNQQHFGVWFQMDPEIKLSGQGTDGAEGYVLSWESKKVGNGSQKITKIEGTDTVWSELDFGFGDPATGHFFLRETGTDQTEVTWGISGKSPYPFNVVNLFMNMDKDFGTGLQQLKKVLESQ